MPEGLSTVQIGRDVLRVTPMPAEIAKAIAAVMSKVTGVSKSGTNEFHRYKFVKVGDLIFELQPAMAEAGLVITQTEIARTILDDTLLVDYAFVLSHVSGVTWEQPIIKTGMATMRNKNGSVDDKAHNKCHTAARKYFLLGLFNVPTLEEGDQRLHDGDADQQGDPPPRQRASKPKDESKKESKPADPQEDEMRKIFLRIRDAIRVATTQDECERAWMDNKADLDRLKGFNASAYDILGKDYSAAVARVKENA